jgi:hypothetical protein
MIYMDNLEINRKYTSITEKEKPDWSKTYPQTQCAIEMMEH